MSPVQSSDRPVGQAEALEHRLGIARQRLELVVRLLGRRELHELDLVELVLPDQAAHVGAVRPGLAAEARRVGRVLERQPRRSSISSRWRLVSGTSAVGMRIQIPVAGDLEQVLLELRQVAGADERRRSDEKRRLHLGVAVLARVQVEHERDERARQPRAGAEQHREARAGHPRRPLEVEDAERGPEVPVRLRLEVERPRLASTAHLDVVGRRRCRPGRSRAAGSAAAAAAPCAAARSPRARASSSLISSARSCWLRAGPRRPRPPAWPSRWPRRRWLRSTLQRLDLGAGAIADRGRAPASVSSAAVERRAARSEPRDDLVETSRMRAGSSICCILADLTRAGRRMTSRRWSSEASRPQGSLPRRRTRHAVPAGDQGAAEGDAAARRQADHPVRRRGSRWPSGVDNMILVTGRGKNAIEDHFDVNVELETFLEARGKLDQLEEIRSISDSINFAYVRQGEPLGLGHAVLVTRDLVGDEPFAVILGDDVIDARSAGAEADDGRVRPGAGPGPRRRARAARRTSAATASSTPSRSATAARLSHHGSGREAAARGRAVRSRDHRPLHPDAGHLRHARRRPAATGPARSS